MEYLYIKSNKHKPIQQIEYVHDWCDELWRVLLVRFLNSICVF